MVSPCIQTSCFLLQKQITVLLWAHEYRVTILFQSSLCASPNRNCIPHIYRIYIDHTVFSIPRVGVQSIAPICVIFNPWQYCYYYYRRLHSSFPVPLPFPEAIIPTFFLFLFTCYPTGLDSLHRGHNAIHLCVINIQFDTPWVHHDTWHVTKMQHGFLFNWYNR